MRKSVIGLTAVGIALLVLPLPAVGQARPGELVLTIPESAAQDLLDAATPFVGQTPDGIHYRIEDARLSFRNRRITVTAHVDLSGYLDVLGQEIELRLDGSIDAELVLGLHSDTRTIRGRLMVSRLSVGELDRLVEAQDLTRFLNAHLADFEYPLDLPAAHLPDLGLQLQGAITGYEIRDGELRIFSRTRASELR